MCFQNDLRMTKWFISIDVDQFLGSIKATLGSLLERYTAAEITDKLGSSILATVFRQLVIHSFNSRDFELPSCTIIKLTVLTVISLVVLADDFTSGAVLSGHPSQRAAEELLLSGRAAQKPIQ